MALWGMGVMVAPIIGPVLGGWLTDDFNWRWVFYINLPIGVIALLLISTFVPETERDRSRSFDFFGFGMLSLAVGSLQLMLDRGENQGWFGSTEIIIECVVAALCFYLFVVQTLTAERPFISPGLFRDRNLVGCMLCMFTVGVVLFSSMALLPPFLQSLMNYPVMTIGNVLAPRGAGTMVAMLIVGRLITRADPRLMILFGMTLTATSLWQMSGFDTDITPRLLITTGLLQGFGLGFIFVPLSTIAFSTLDPKYRGEATGVFNLMRNIGSSIGISICFALVSQFTQINHAALVEHVTPFNQLFQSPSLPQAWDLGTASGVAALDSMITAQAATIGYLNDFKLMMWLILGLAPLVMILQRPRFAPSKDAVAVMD
jgi:DHA2 family multidrug resistance protein